MSRSDWLTLSLDLHKAGLDKKDELWLRCSTSRAYYACYHAALSYAKTKGYDFDKRCGKDASKKDRMGMHECLQDFFEGSNDPNTYDIGGKLRRLHKARCDADYMRAQVWGELKSKEWYDFAISLEKLIKQVSEANP